MCEAWTSKGGGGWTVAVADTTVTAGRVEAAVGVEVEDTYRACRRQRRRKANATHFLLALVEEGEAHVFYDDFGFVVGRRSSELGHRSRGLYGPINGIL